MIPLTKKEILLAAEVAEDYPPGFGASFIAMDLNQGDGPILGRVRDAISYLKSYPGLFVLT